jgi:hypothetical protein
MPVRHLALSILALSLGSASAWAAQPVPALRNIIIPHRAYYDVALARSDDGSDVASAEGKMVFEVTGSACEGYRMRQRMVVNIGDEDGNNGLLDFRIITFESGDGDVYDFDSRTTLNEQTVEAVKGEARRVGPVVEVKLEEPAVKTVTMAGDVLFPSQHMQVIIDAALAKRRFLASDIYEGAGTGEASDDAAVAIGGALPLATDTPLRNGVAHWPVSVGYFDPDKANEHGLGEELPTYQMSFTLYENGITNDLLMDYGDYALSASLKKIEPIAKPACGSR